MTPDEIKKALWERILAAVSDKQMAAIVTAVGALLWSGLNHQQQAALEKQDNTRYIATIAIASQGISCSDSIRDEIADLKREIAINRAWIISKDQEIKRIREREEIIEPIPQPHREPTGLSKLLPWNWFRRR